MKKTCALLSMSTLFFVGCNAHAQNLGTVVGNPDSANTVIIQRGYEAVIETPAQPNQPAMVPNMPTQAPANFQAPETVSGAAVIETITDVQSPSIENMDNNETMF